MDEEHIPGHASCNFNQTIRLDPEKFLTFLWHGVTHVNNGEAENVI